MSALLGASRAALALASLLACTAILRAQEPTNRVRLPVTRDTWVSSAPDEQDCNLGGATRLKTKGIQELALIDVDARALRGRVIERATLHVHVASTDVLRRASVSTIASDWVEGRASSYEREQGSACFRWAALDERAWSYAGSDVTSVILGAGNTLWRFADATAPDDRGWQTIAIDPDVVAARLAELSYGMALVDDVGSEYTRDGDAFSYHMFLNRFVHSREEGARRAPFIEVELGADDHEAPDPVGAIEVDVRGLAAGEARVSWMAPADHGRAGTLGFDVVIARARASSSDASAARFDWTAARAVPRYLVPMAKLPGARVVMHVRDLGLEPAERVALRLSTVDRAGNRSSATDVELTLAARAKPIELDARAIVGSLAREDAKTDVATLGSVHVGVIDGLDKLAPSGGELVPASGELAPSGGELVPARPRTYVDDNHLWSAAQRTIRLQAARNEHVDFQLVTSPANAAIDAHLTLDEPSLRARFFACRAVSSSAGALPDPLVPLGESAARIEPATPSAHASTFVEIYVPHDARAGVHRGTLELRMGDARLELALELTAWDFALPDHLSFLTEMNCYGLPDAPRDREYYRLAHEHRTCLNRLGYNWQGRVHAGCAPKWSADGVDWTEYDAHFGALLDGSAFADLPRAGVPLDVFYLPLNENWPIPIEPAFEGGYWADEALDPRYLQAFADACGRFAAHVDERKWHDTLFEFYLNNKVFFKDASWSRCSAPWIFDEPMNTQDFWALRVFGKAFHSGVAGRRGAARMAFRCDVSRPQWQRELLDGLLDVAVVGSAIRPYERVVAQRKQRNGELVINYSSPNPIETSNANAIAWALDAWCLGADGIVPWQTIGTDASWKSADALALFYPGETIGRTGPLPSLRLKAYRRAQQDVEYLIALMQATASERASVVELVRGALDLSVRSERRNAEDAGQLSYDAITPERLWSLRTRIGATLSRLHPPTTERRVDFTPLRRDVSRIDDAGHVRTRSR